MINIIVDLTQFSGKFFPQSVDIYVGQILTVYLPEYAGINNTWTVLQSDLITQKLDNVVSLADSRCANNTGSDIMTNATDGTNTTGTCTM